VRKSNVAHNVGEGGLIAVCLLKSHATTNSHASPEPWARYRKAAESAYLHVQEFMGNTA
jgi:hypothetical protein